MKALIFFLSSIVVMVNNAAMMGYWFMPNKVTLPVSIGIILVTILGLAYYASTKVIAKPILAGFLIGSVTFFYSMSGTRDLIELLTNTGISFAVYSLAFLFFYQIISKKLYSLK